MNKGITNGENNRNSSNSFVLVLVISEAPHFNSKPFWFFFVFGLEYIFA